MLIAVAASTVVVLAAAACSSSGGTSSGSGGTAVWAEQPSSPPNYIFPYVSSAYASYNNVNEFQVLMYRPLYWFGDNGKPAVNPSLSLANTPTFRGNKVTITLKHYMWSNGRPVTAQNVVFWVHMQQAVPQDYGVYNGFPSKFVKNIKAVNPRELTMTLDKAYSPTWFLYNNLSQITPMPSAWDRTASGPSNCTGNVNDCAAVYKYLDAQSKNMSSYVRSPIWSIVDGPWKLSAFNADGHVSFTPNKSYSGPVKPRLAKFEEVPFTTDSAEFLVLQAGSSGGQKIDVGYIPAQNLPAKRQDTRVGANAPALADSYTLDPLYLWGINYFLLNFQSSTGNAPITRQLYFRQALAYLTNQNSVIQGPMRGYGVATVGTVGNIPVTRFLSPQGRRGVPYPYDPAKAKSLLKSHGWKIVPGGLSTCVNPALCGSGIKKGQGLGNFNFRYPTGTAWQVAEVTAFQSNLAQAGIGLNLEPATPNQVDAQIIGNCVLAKTPCNWDIGYYGNFTFYPDYFPSGESLWSCGLIGNSGGYCDKTADALIEKTLTSNNMSDMYAYQDYIADQLPVIWQPTAAYSLTEIANNLHGVTPQNPSLSLNPENWYFTK